MSASDCKSDSASANWTPRPQNCGIPSTGRIWQRCSWQEIECLQGFACLKGSESLLDCDRKVDATRDETRIHGRILARGQVALENNKLKFVSRKFVASFELL